MFQYRNRMIGPAHGLAHPDGVFEAECIMHWHQAIADAYLVGREMWANERRRRIEAGESLDGCGPNEVQMKIDQWLTFLGMLPPRPEDPLPGIIEEVEEDADAEDTDISTLPSLTPVTSRDSSNSSTSCDSTTRRKWPWMRFRSLSTPSLSLSSSSWKKIARRSSVTFPLKVGRFLTSRTSLVFRPSQWSSKNKDKDKADWNEGKRAASIPIPARKKTMSMPASLDTYAIPSLKQENQGPINQTPTRRIVSRRMTVDDSQSRLALQRLTQMSLRSPPTTPKKKEKTTRKRSGTLSTVEQYWDDNIPPSLSKYGHRKRGDMDVWRNPVRKVPLPPDDENLRSTVPASVCASTSVLEGPSKPPKRGMIRWVAAAKGRSIDSIQCSLCHHDFHAARHRIQIHLTEPQVSNQVSTQALNALRSESLPQSATQGIFVFVTIRDYCHNEFILSFPGMASPGTQSSASTPPVSSNSTSHSRGRGNHRSRGGLGKYLRARGRGRSYGRPAEFTERLLLETDLKSEDLDEDEAKEKAVKYSRRNLGSNADRYKEPEPELDSDGEPIVEPEVDLSSFLERQRLNEEPAPVTQQAVEDDEDVDASLIQSSHISGSSKKGQLQQIDWTDELSALEREKTAAEAASDLKARFRAKSERLRKEPAILKNHERPKDDGKVEAPPLPLQDGTLPQKTQKQDMEDFLDDLLG